jgi:hypothetical protein
MAQQIEKCDGDVIMCSNLFQDMFEKRGSTELVHEDDGDHHRRKSGAW